MRHFVITNLLLLYEAEYLSPRHVFSWRFLPATRAVSPKCSTTCVWHARRRPEEKIRSWRRSRASPRGRRCTHCEARWRSRAAGRRGAGAARFELQAPPNAAPGCGGSIPRRGRPDRTRRHRRAGEPNVQRFFATYPGADGTTTGTTSKVARATSQKRDDRARTERTS